MNKTFISHSTSDAAWLSRLKDALRGYGLDGFLAHEDIEHDADWADEIRRELDECAVLLVFWGKDASGSPWVNQEFGYALGRGIPVLSIKCGGTPVGLRADKQAFRVTEHERAANREQYPVARRIFEALEPSLGDAAIEGLVDAFATAKSFENARESINALRDRASKLTDEQVARLRAALDTNHHSAQLYTAHERIDEIENLRQDATDF